MSKVKATVEMVRVITSPEMKFDRSRDLVVKSVTYMGKKVPFVQKDGYVYFGSDSGYLGTDLQPSDSKPSTGNSEAQ